MLGKLLASLLGVLVIIGSLAPFFLLLTLLGGISFGQVLQLLVVTAACGIAAGSLGSVIALWRENTFQALALTVLALVGWLAFGEVVGSDFWAPRPYGLTGSELANRISPWRAVMTVVRAESDDNVRWFLIVASGIACVANLLAVVMLRRWNPPREVIRVDRELPAEDSLHADSAADSEVAAARRAAHRAPGRVRPVWNNPVLWRELRTWVHGKKILLVRLAYLVIAALCVWGTVVVAGGDSSNRFTALPSVAAPFVTLVLVGVLMVNALAVTSITTERDSKALDLLLVTDITPREFVWGKLAGAFYNGKEMIAIPLLLAAWLGASGYATTEQSVLLALAVFVVFAFAATVGLHIGMNYASSRQAVGLSLGTLLFLFLGIAVCMRLMLAVGDRFEAQLPPFLAFIVGGGAGLWAALGWRNPSGAITLASFAAPLATYYIITSLLLHNYGPAFAVTVTAYGFTIVALLVPAIAEFDVVTGRSSEREG